MTPSVVVGAGRIRVKIGRTHPSTSWSAKADHPRFAVLVERHPWMVGLRRPRRDNSQRAHGAYLNAYGAQAGHPRLLPL
jgi:hypothetical protein